ncbi:MAG: hypothetical protein IH598_02750 [Bacteroidales bacterium]|nr:hypothetical protein [Bacteroidales bacterium]
MDNIGIKSELEMNTYIIQTAISGRPKSLIHGGLKPATTASVSEMPILNVFKLTFM